MAACVNRVSTARGGHSEFQLPQGQAERVDIHPEGSEGHIHARAISQRG